MRMDWASGDEMGGHLTQRQTFQTTLDFSHHSRPYACVTMKDKPRGKRPILEAGKISLAVLSDSIYLVF